jgi:PmbA protein
MVERTDVLQSRATAAVELALKGGATHAWANASSSRSTDCEVRDGKLEKMQQSNSRSLALELYVDGRYFEHSTSDLRDAQMKEFIDEAIALTRALQPDPFRQLPDPKLYEGVSTVDLDAVDPSLEKLKAQERIDRCLQVDARMAGKDKVISASSSLSDGVWQGAAASSNGFTGAFATTWYALSGSVTLQDEGDKRPEGGMWANMRHASDMPSAEWIGDEALERGRQRLGTRKGPTMTATLIVDAMAVGRLIHFLLQPASGRAVQQGRSFWKEKKGKKVISKKLEVIDDPLIPRGNNSRPFDFEGIAAKKMTMIADGTLQNYYLDTYYARKLELPPTTAHSSNLIVKPGKASLSDLIANVNKGVYVTSWLGGNSDPTSGEFSLGLRGHLVKKGKLDAAVGEMNVTGNVLQLFEKLAVVGGDVWKYGSLRAPSLVFDGVSFSGA